MKKLMLSFCLMLTIAQANATSQAMINIGETLLMTTVGPFAVTSSTICAIADKRCFMSKELVVAKADALDYLAGEQPTEALISAVALVKSSDSKLSEISDEEIIQIIATLE